MIAEIKQAVRLLINRPGLSIAATLTIGVGIGLSTSVFSAVDAVLLRELPYPDPDQIFKLEIGRTGSPDESFGFRKTELEAFRDLSESAGDFGTAFGLEAVLESDEPVRITGMMIDHSYLEILGARQVAGRLFTEEDIVTRAPVAMVSEDFFQTNMGSEAGIVGSTVIIGGTSYEIIGVLGSSLISPEGPADFFISYNHGTDNWTGRWLSIYGRAAEGATLEAVERQTTSAALEIAAGSGSQDLETRAIGLRSALVGTVGSATTLVFAASTLILLIACINVSGLFLARTVERSRELAVRMSLGARRGDLLRLLVAEAMAIAVPGTAIGVALAHTTIRLIRSVIPAEVYGAGAMEVNAFAMAFALATMLVAVFGTVLAPLVMVWSTRPSGVLTTRTNSVSRSTRMGFNTLVTAEIALGLTLVVSAGLVFQSLLTLAGDEKGFDPERVTATRITLPDSRYPDAASKAAFFAAISERAETVSGIEHAGFLSHLPVSGRHNWWRVNSDARIASGNTERLQAVSRVVTPGGLEALGVELIDGRDFDLSDDELSNDRVIVNEALAAQLWPGESPVGRSLTSSTDPQDDDWIEVVGVVSDVRFTSVRLSAAPQIYTPQAQRGWGEMYLVASGDGGTMSGLGQIVREMDNRVVADPTIRFSDLVAGTMAMDRFLATLFLSFGVAALGLIAIGIYGVVSFVVRTRVREYGVRAAIGAVPGRLAGSVFGESGKLLVVGALVGMVGAWSAGNLLSSILYQTSAIELPSILAALFAITAAATAASMLPALRAMRANPAEVLRED